MARHTEIYQASEWKRSRRSVIIRSNGLCERCMKKGKIKPGKIVHHKKWLTDENKTNWNIAYDPDNLIYLCNSCHEDVHDRTTGLQKFVEPI